MSDMVYNGYIFASYSLGEYAAFVAAGVLTLDAGLQLVAHHARLVTDHCAKSLTGMLAVRLLNDVTEEALASTQIRRIHDRLLQWTQRLYRWRIHYAARGIERDLKTIKSGICKCTRNICNHASSVALILD